MFEAARALAKAGRGGLAANCPKRDFFLNSVTSESSAPLAGEHVLGPVCRGMRQKPVVVVVGVRLG